MNKKYQISLRALFDCPRSIGLTIWT